MKTFDSLPASLAVFIFKYLEGKELLLQVALVSQRWNRFSFDPVCWEESLKNNGFGWTLIDKSCWNQRPFHSDSVLNTKVTLKRCTKASISLANFWAFFVLEDLPIEQLSLHIFPARLWYFTKPKKMLTVKTLLCWHIQEEKDFEAALYCFPEIRHLLLFDVGPAKFDSLSWVFKKLFNLEAVHLTDQLFFYPGFLDWLQHAKKLKLLYLHISAECTFEKLVCLFENHLLLEKITLNQTIQFWEYGEPFLWTRFRKILWQRIQLQTRTELQFFTPLSLSIFKKFCKNLAPEITIKTQKKKQEPSWSLLFCENKNHSKDKNKNIELFY